MKKKTDRKSFCLVLLAWLVYATSYLGKVNYSANIAQIVDHYNITKAEAGLVPTFFFFAYGIGQVINGVLCKKYNIKWMVGISLALSGFINLAVALTTDFSVVKWLWMANGLLLSALWPTLIRLLSENLPQKDLGKAGVIMGTTVATGTLVIYAASSVYAVFDHFKLAFYTAAFAAIAVSILWLFFFRRVVGEEKKGKTEETSHLTEDQIKMSGLRRKNTLVSLCVLCFCAIGVNLIKDGLTTWVPSILKEEASVSDALSILLTLFLPIVAIFGNAVALYMHNRIPGYTTQCLVTFSVMAIMIGTIIGILSSQMVIAILIVLVIVNLLASSLNSLVTSIFTMFMRDTLDSGKVAGVLNGFCYLGSTISSYGLGAVADHFGWGAVFRCLLGACITASLVCLFHRIWEKSRNRADDR